MVSPELALPARRTLTEALGGDGFVEELVAEGGMLDQLVSLDEIARLIPGLSKCADSLHRAVGPLGDLVGCLSGGRRRPWAVGS